LESLATAIGKFRGSDVQQVAGGQSVHDEQDEECDQKGLRSIAEQDDDRLHRQVVVDIRQSRLDVEQADHMRVFTAVGQRKLLHDGPLGLSLATEDRERMGGRGSLPEKGRGCLESCARARVTVEAAPAQGTAGGNPRKISGPTPRAPAAL
jgi:hypothetical protein